MLVSQGREDEPPRDPGGQSGRSVVAVIGIDHYQGWPRLTNAVSDARGAADLFVRLGFEQVTAPLLDEAATGQAIQKLVRDDLTMLGPYDSLVLFFAGHGKTRTHRLGDHEIKSGYLLPADASDKAVTWIELSGWLRDVSLLQAKHILVILDACHSGVALAPIIKWRDAETWRDTPLPTLRERRSRRIITSALDDQVALDSGPVHGHSLFTGCLIEGLTHGLGDDRPVMTGSELGLYLQRRVETYPDSRQTPDFGTFDYDERGELVIPLAIDRSDAVEPHRQLATVLPDPGAKGHPAGTSPGTDLAVVAVRSEIKIGFPVSRYTIRNNSVRSQIISKVEVEVLGYYVPKSRSIPWTRVLVPVSMIDVVLPPRVGTISIDLPEPVLIAADDAVTIALRFVYRHDGKVFSPRQVGDYRIAISFVSDTDARARAAPEHLVSREGLGHMVLVGLGMSLVIVLAAAAYMMFR